MSNLFTRKVSRRAGGLENQKTKKIIEGNVSRRAGGLEIEHTRCTQM